MTPAELAANTLSLAAMDPRLLLECRLKEHAAGLQLARKIRQAARKIRKAEGFKRQVAAAYRCMRPEPITDDEATDVATDNAKGSESITDEVTVIVCL